MGPVAGTGSKQATVGELAWVLVLMRQENRHGAVVH